MLPPFNVAFVALLGAAPIALPGPSAPTVSGHIKVIDRGGNPAQDVDQAVLWLMPAHGNPPAVAPGHADVITQNRTFNPHVTVVSLGSTVRFPNRDGFNHNVFSLTEGDQFDLGLQDRGEGKSTTFNAPGVVNVFCNVHSTMSAIVLVRNTPWFAQPSADGSFSIANVPPGEYVLHAFHERAGESTRPVTVTGAGATLPDLQLDARGYVQQEHLNKFGRPYARTGRRY